MTTTTPPVVERATFTAALANPHPHGGTTRLAYIAADDMARRVHADAIAYGHPAPLAEAHAHAHDTADAIAPHHAQRIAALIVRRIGADDIAPYGFTACACGNHATDTLRGGYPTCWGCAAEARSAMFATPTGPPMA